MSFFLESFHRMAGGGADAAEEAKLKGMGKIFNGVTMKGRANVSLFDNQLPASNGHYLCFQVAKATYASIGVLILYFSLKPSKK